MKMEFFNSHSLLHSKSLDKPSGLIQPEQICKWSNLSAQPEPRSGSAVVHIQIARQPSLEQVDNLMPDSNIEHDEEDNRRCDFRSDDLDLRAKLTDSIHPTPALS